MQSDSATNTIGLAVGLVLFLSCLLAERFGVGADIIRIIIFLVLAVLVLLAGLASSSLRIENQFAGGGVQSGWAVASVLAAAAWSGGMLFGSAGPLPAPGLLAAMTIGLLIVGAATARRGAAHSYGDFLQARFGSGLPAIVVGVLAGLSLAVLAAAAAPQSVAVIAGATQLSPAAARVVALVFVFATALAGGIGSIGAVAAFVVVVALLAWSAPLALAVLKGGAGVVIAALDVSTSGPLLAAPPLNLVALAGTALAFAGFLALLNIPGWNAAPETSRGAAYAVLGVVALALLAGLVQPAGGGDPILMLTASAGLPVALAAVHALLSPVLGLIGFALLVHGSAQCLTQDVIFRALSPKATSSARLALHRLAVALIAVLAMLQQVPAQLMGAIPADAAIFCLAAVPLPLLLLAGYRRADAKAALCAIAAAGCVAAAYPWGYIAREFAPTAGFLAAICAGMLAARLFGRSA